MEICAVISEYNPFHTGHLYHLTRTKQLLSRDCARIALMSGNFVQRGECALAEKYLRARACVQAGGADLVLELPLPAALSSAERFASSGVQLAAALGCVTHLSFGCEHANITALRAVAQALNRPEHARYLREGLADGQSYASAAQQAVQRICPAYAPLLSHPNNTLAIQYCRAIQRETPSIQPLAVERLGAGHDSTDTGITASASHIRRMLAQKQDVSAFLPPAVQDILAQARLHTLSDMESAILPYLRRFTPEQLRAFPSVSEGLEHRFFRAAQSAGSLEELLDGVRSRRFPLSRVRRLILCAYLGITEELAALAPQYVLVLAMNERGRSVLRTMKTTCSLPVITKPTQAQALTGCAKRIWDATCLADDLYAFPESAGQDWKKSPFFCAMP